MGIDAYWKDELGVVLGEIGDPEFLLSDAIIDNPFPHTGTCFRFIDVAGDACFNQLQLPELETDLLRVIDALPTGSVRSHVERVAALVHAAIGRTHTYVWFVGD